MQGKSYRLRMLGRIHVGQKQLGLDDASYRAILERVAGIRSAKDATPQQLALILVEFHRLGWESGKEPPRPRGTKRRPTPGEATRAQVGKVWALLGDRPPEYAEGILKRMYGDGAPAKLEWADGAMLGKLIAALAVDAKRKAKTRRRMTERLYEPANLRDRKLRRHVERHMLAMTAEDLHDKGEIAIQLAIRDAEIEKLREQVRLEKACRNLAETQLSVDAKRKAERAETTE